MSTNPVGNASVGVFVSMLLIVGLILTVSEFRQVGPRYRTQQ